jgi:NAD kinase
MAEPWATKLNATWKTDPVRMAQFSTQRLGQLCFFGINKIEEALSAILYDEGVPPETRVRIKESMHRKLEDIAQDLIVEALNKKMLSEERLKATLKRKKRTVILDEEDDQ